MPPILRMMTTKEHELITRALPLKLRALMKEIDSVPMTCWTCDVRQFDENYCTKWEIPIPQEQMREGCEAWQQCVIPF